ncbi:hypothetical protein SAMN06265348_107287 [Pedobacter westerhofensis]|uniref:Uncharacterized protein n=1 Tax=Pedobacter westerhofensis TaxID=425512 RepID=A0A521EA03_9SPHI|nr:hypothetical protein SAMN06265348_107287 [Pedobacter westerhofensis]
MFIALEFTHDREYHSYAVLIPYPNQENSIE